MIHARHWGSAADPDTEIFSTLKPWPAPLVLEFGREVEVDGLFAEDVLATASRIFDDPCVRIQARENQDRLDVAILRFRERDLRNRRHLHFGNLVGQVFEMDAPDPTCPDYADSDFSAYGKHLLIPS